MLDRLIVNAVYLVPLHVNKFKKQHPDAEVLIADGTKARLVKSNEEAKREMGWVTARRSTLILTTKGLFCGDWTIPLANIQEAALLQIAGGSILKISTNDGLHYQFGLQRNPAWEEQTVLPLNVQESTLGFSKASLVSRIIVIAMLAYLLFQEYMRNGVSIAGFFLFILLVVMVYPLLKLINFRKKQ